MMIRKVWHYLSVRITNVMFVYATKVDHEHLKLKALYMFHRCVEEETRVHGM